MDADDQPAEDSSPEASMRNARAMFPEYDEALLQLLATLIREVAVLEHPMLQDTPTVPVSEILPSSNVGRGRSSGPLRLRTETSTASRAISDGDVAQWTEFVYSLGSQLGDQMARQFIEFLQKTTSETGNVIDAQGKPLSVDMLLDMVERMAIQVGDDGKPKDLALLMHPALAERLKALPEMTPEQRARFERIMLKKKQEQDAAKRRRTMD